MNDTTYVYRGFTIVGSDWTRAIRKRTRRRGLGTMTERRFFIDDKYATVPGFSRRGYLRLADAREAINAIYDEETT